MKNNLKSINILFANNILLYYSARGLKFTKINWEEIMGKVIKKMTMILFLSFLCVSMSKVYSVKVVMDFEGAVGKATYKDDGFGMRQWVFLQFDKTKGSIYENQVCLIDVNDGTILKNIIFPCSHKLMFNMDDPTRPFKLSIGDPGNSMEFMCDLGSILKKRTYSKDEMVQVTVSCLLPHVSCSIGCDGVVFPCFSSGFRPIDEAIKSYYDEGQQARIAHEQGAILSSGMGHTGMGS